MFYECALNMSYFDISNAINPPAAAIGHPILAAQAANLNIGVLNPVGSMYQTVDPRLTQSMVRFSLYFPVYWFYL